tara:strand:+ start:6387 stop:6650 length:264 start_codon:yes stop_codon:yes gene_type:complete
MEEEKKIEKEIKVKELKNTEEDKVVEKTELDSMGKGVEEMEAKMDDLTTKKKEASSETKEATSETKEVDEIISDLDKKEEVSGKEEE